MLNNCDFVLSFVLNFFCQNQGFCFHKVALIKKEGYIHHGKRQMFSEFFIFTKCIPPTIWVERKQFYFVHQTNISLWTSYCAIRNGSRNPLNSEIELFMTTVGDWKFYTIVTKRPTFKIAKFLDLPLAFTNLQKL